MGRVEPSMAAATAAQSINSGISCLSLMKYPFRDLLPNATEWM